MADKNIATILLNLGNDSYEGLDGGERWPAGGGGSGILWLVKI